MGKRIFSILIVAAMCLTLLPTWAWAAETDAEAEPESTVEITSEWFDLGDITTSAEPSRLFSTFSLLSSATDTVELAAGTHVDWIDRVDLTDCPAAKNFYDTLVEGSDGDGTDDVLIDDQYFTNNVSTGTVQLNYSDTTDTFNAIPVTTIERDSEMDSSEKEYIRSCITAAWNAFDRDHPEVFWLSGSSNVNIVTSKATTTSDGVTTTTYTYKYYFILKSFNGDGNDLDIRSEEYQSAEAIKAGIATRNSQVQTILGGLPEGATTYDTILYFNNWLTEHNAYNSAVAAGNKDSASKSAWECISALTGKTGTEGPVCEGYARAFKVLCDQVNIPCVLVDGQAASQPGGTTEAHMWNNVQVDGTWYAVDVTWNDPTSSSGDNTAVVSGLENQNWLLVGSDTTIGNITFGDSHTIANKVSTNGIAFTNGPSLSTTSYVDPKAPATIGLFYTPEKDGTSNKGNPVFYIPNVTDLNTSASRDITLTAQIKDEDGNDLTGQTVEWSLSPTLAGITLTPASDNTATLTITSALGNDSQYNSSGPVITVSATCSTTKAEQSFTIIVQTRKAAFVQILKENDVVMSDTLAAGDSTTYTAKVYDQYGMEMSDQTVTWAVSDNSLATVNGGTVTVNDSAADNGSFTVTATAGTNVTASVSVSIASSNSHNLIYHAAVAATCTEAGNTEYWYCETCNKYYSDANEANEITQASTVIPALGHTWGEWTVTKAATENENGEQTRTCSRCGETETKEIIALTITSGTAVTYGTTLALTTSGGSGNGAVTFTVADGTGAATVSGSTLTPTKAGNVTVTATKAADETSVATTATMTITINPATLTPSITGNTTTKTYDGKANAPDGLSIQLAGVVNGDAVTAEAASYTYNSANVSEANTITATGITLAGDKANNYKLSSDTAAVYGSITAKAITIAGAKIEDKTYDGTTNATVNSVTFDGLVTGETLIQGAGYTVSAAFTTADAGDNQEVTVTVTLCNDNYTLDTSNPFRTIGTIAPASLGNAVVTLTIPSEGYTYDGLEKKPGVTVKLDSKTLSAETDYTVSYTNNTNAGNATVTVTGKSNYTGNATTTFSIAKATPDFTVSYSGEAIYISTVAANVVLTRSNDAVPGILQLNDATFTVGTGDYPWTFTPSDATNYNTVTGTIQLTVSEDTLRKIEATGTPTKTNYTYGDSFDMSGLTVTATYASGAMVAVTDKVTASALKVGDTSVTLSYTDSAGTTVTCTVSGITVNKKHLDVSGMHWNVNTSGYTYNGGVQGPTLTGTLPNGVTVTKTGDSATDAGSYTASAAFALADGYSSDNYEIIGTNPLTASWNIAKADQAELTITGKPTGSIAFGSEFTLATSGGSGNGAVTWSITDDTGYATVDGNGKVTVNGVGQITVTATKAGDTNYNEVSDTWTFTSTKKQQAALSITGLPNTITYGDSAFALTASGGSGDGAVTWEITAGGEYATVNNGNVSVTGVGTVEVKITKAGDSNYESATATAAFTIQPKEITAAITGTDFGKTYDGTMNVPNGLSIQLDGVVTGDTVTATATSYAYDSADAGSRTITATGITLSGDKAANYTLSNTTATVAGTITAKDISDAEVTLGGELTFNGSAQTPSITNVTVDNLTVTYTVTGNTGTNAGSYKMTITGSGNFTGSVTKAWSIAKAAAPIVEQQERQHLRASSATGSIDLSALLPDNRGTTTYSITSGNYNGLESATVTEGTLTYTTKATSEAVTDTITVTAEMANYETATITVTVKLVEKTSVTITGVTAQNGTYNGSAQAGYTGTPDSDYKGNYTVTYAGRNGTVYDDSTTAPSAAGDYTVTIAVPDSDAQYTGSVSLDFTVGQKPVTISGVQATARDYEAGNTTVTLTGGTLDGVVNGDDVSFTLGTGAIADANAGTGKAVTVTGSTLTGGDAGNYTLTQPTGITVTINKIDPTGYTVPSNVTAAFGQTLADAVIGTPGTGGSWTWETPAEKVGNVGTNNHNMVLTPTDSTNYNTVTTAVPVVVSKAAAPTLADQTVSVKYNAVSEQTVSLAALMPADAGALSYAAGTKTDSDSIIGSWSVSGGTLTYALTSGLDSTKAGKTATLPVTISSANYEDATVNVVVTLTDLQAQAALSITSGTAVTYGSTLALTTSGGSGSGAVTFTVTNGTGEAVVSGSTLTPTKAGTVTVTATKAADGTYAEAAATLTITINPASIANAKVTLNPTAIAGSVNDDEARTTNVESVKLNGSTLTAGKDYTVSIPTGMKKAGDYTITITGTGNYTGTATATFTINPVTEAPALPPELTETDTNKFKVEVETGLSEVPAAFTGNAELNTPEKIETKLTTEITTVNTAIPETNVAVYDVTLMVSTDSGLTWTKASAANFPTGGKLTVTLPYPEGTDSSYTFTVVHMFTTSDFGKTPGETETPTVTNTADGIQFQVTGLSPISVGWTAPKPNNNGGHGSHGNHGGYISTTITYPVIVDTVANGTVEASVARAAKGTTVTITAIPDEGYELVDLVVLDAATKVSLTQIGENKFTFKMPAASVMIQAAFTKIIKALPFTDVRAGVYYYDSVVWAVENEITDGYGSATTFAPDVKCSRAEAVTFLWRAAGQPKPMTTENPFTDVSENAYYYQAVLWAVENGITNGYNSDTTFAPDVKCSRAEIVTFLYRAAGSPVVSSGGSFDDVSDNAYYAKAVAWAVKYGITDGYGSDIFFVPDEKCSRAEIVTFLYRTYAN